LFYPTEKVAIINYSYSYILTSIDQMFIKLEADLLTH